MEDMGEEHKINLELILHRLDNIAKNQEIHSDRLCSIEKQLNAIGTHEYEIKTLKDWKAGVDGIASIGDFKDLMNWKHNIDEIVSTSQLKEKMVDIEKLKIFKTQALMIWVIIQALMAIAMFAQKFM